jgi:G3E family GTPase
VENESVEQVGFADRILLSKLDLVDKEYEQTVRKKLSQINGTVEIIPVNKGVVDLSKILNIKAFDLDKILVRASTAVTPIRCAYVCMSIRTWTRSSSWTRSTSTTNRSRALASPSRYQSEVALNRT